MSKKVMFIISTHPAKDTEGVSEALAQALTALSFGYECNIFLRSDGVELGRTGALEGLKAPTFEPLTMMIEHFLEMNGRIFSCHPACDARQMDGKNCIAQLEFINASKLIEYSIEADSVITY